jgi:hypothetical protein
VGYRLVPPAREPLPATRADGAHPEGTDAAG